MKTLYLSESNRKIAGVCGGMGEYFEVDPTIIRLVAVGVAIMTGILPVVIGYLLAWAIIPSPAQPSA